MDLPLSEASSLKDKSTVLREEIDDVAKCLEDITLADVESLDGKAKVEKSVEGDSIHINKLNKLIEEDKQSHDGEKVKDKQSHDREKVEDKQSHDGEKVEDQQSHDGEKVEDQQSHDGEKFEDQQSHDGEKDEKNTEVADKEEITQVDKRIEENNAQSDKTDESKLIDEESNLKELLQTLQCPFTWKLEHRENPEQILERINEKINEIEDNVSFQWRHFILILVLCYEYHRRKDVYSAFEELRKCETIVNNTDCTDTFYQSTRSALLHVVLACKCYLYLEKGDLDEVKMVLDKICKEEEMDNPCKAAIWGIKAAVSMEYGYEGTKAAHHYVEEALKFDKEQGEWYFLLGKCLGRIRRVDHYNEMPKLEELKALEKAVEISRNPSYIIFLAQSYREAAFRAFSINRYNLETVLKEKIGKMNKRSLELYREALEMRGDCSHVNIRCAQGLYKLPHPYKDVKTAKECCEKALALAPDNAMVHHVRGQIYEQERDYKNAKRHYEKAGELGAYGAFMDLHKVEYKMDESYNPIPRFEHMLQQFVEKPRREETLCQMGSYYFFLKEDLPTAFRNYWHQVIKENPNSDKLKTHKCMFLYMQKPVDIYELLYDEARLALKSTDYKRDEDVKLLREIIRLCLDICPELDEYSPKPRRKIILDESYSNAQSRNRNRGGRGFRGQGQRRERSKGISRNQNQGNERDDNNYSQENRGRASNRRFIPGQRFSRRRCETNWRAD